MKGTVFSLAVFFFPRSTIKEKKDEKIEGFDSLRILDLILRFNWIFRG